MGRCTSNLLISFSVRSFVIFVFLSFCCSLKNRLASAASLSGINSHTNYQIGNTNHIYELLVYMIGITKEYRCRGYFTGTRARLEGRPESGSFVQTLRGHKSFQRERFLDNCLRRTLSLSGILSDLSIHKPR